MEETYLIWLEQMLQTCLDAAQGSCKLIQDKFNVLADQYQIFDEAAKKRIFETAESCLHDGVIYVYSCIFQHTGLQEFGKLIINYVLLHRYEPLIGCMMELQIMNTVQGNYREKRSLHRKNAGQLKQALGYQGTYIPVRLRNPSRIVIITEQIVGLRHAPTDIIVNIAYILKKQMKYEVFIYICPDNYPIPVDLWYRPVIINSAEDVQGRIITFQFRDENFAGYQINMYEEDCMKEYSMMLESIQEWNPAFVLGLGIRNPILELINEITTVAVMEMSIDCPFSDGEILLRTEKRGREMELEYESELRDDQTQIFIEGKMPVMADGQIGGSFSREKLQIQADKFVIAVVGNRLDIEIDTQFIELMKSILTDNPDSAFAIIGGVTKLSEHFKEEEYQGRIFYLGYCPDLQGVYSVMDLYLNPERAGGGWSSEIALKAGVPVVTLPDCDVAYNVGERFVVSDFSEMKTEINRYMSDPDYMKKMKQYAVECGAENTEEKMTKYVQSMMEGISCVLREKE